MFSIDIKGFWSYTLTRSTLASIIDCIAIFIPGTSSLMWSVGGFVGTSLSKIKINSVLNTISNWFPFNLFKKEVIGILSLILIISKRFFIDLRTIKDYQKSKEMVENLRLKLKDSLKEKEYIIYNTFLTL